MSFELPVWIEAVSGDTPITMSARNYRTVTDAIFATEGVVNTTDLVVAQRAAGANMSVDVSAGLVVFQGDSIAGQGKYVARSSTAVNVIVPPAPASGTRSDLVVAQLFDKQADGGTQYAWGVYVLSGVSTAPPSTVVLATLSVPAGTSSITSANIQPAGRQYASLIRTSGLRPVQSIQASGGDLTGMAGYTAGAFTSFPSGVFAPLTVTVPPSGLMWVTISAAIFNSPLSYTIHASWTTTGGTISFGQSSGNADRSLATQGSRIHGSRRTLVTGTPGASVTITPTYYVSQADGGTNGFSNGVLAVEFVA